MKTQMFFSLELDQQKQIFLLQYLSFPLEKFWQLSNFSNKGK